MGVFMPKSILTVCCLALLAVGCGGNKPPTVEEGKEGVLSQVGEMYRNYQMVKNKPPEKFSELASVRSVSGNGYEAVRTGDVILRYGVPLPDTKEEPGQSSSGEVLAYEKNVPNEGGRVLLLNRTIKTMTPEEFKAATRASTPNSSGHPPAK
jgi:hypothetical protein